VILARSWGDAGTDRDHLSPAGSYRPPVASVGRCSHPHESSLCPSRLRWSRRAGRSATRIDIAVQASTRVRERAGPAARAGEAGHASVPRMKGPGAPARDDAACHHATRTVPGVRILPLPPTVVRAPPEAPPAGIPPSMCIVPAMRQSSGTAGRSSTVNMRCACGTARAAGRSSTVNMRCAAAPPAPPARIPPSISVAPAVPPAPAIPPPAVRQLPRASSRNDRGAAGACGRLGRVFIPVEQAAGSARRTKTTDNSDLEMVIDPSLSMGLKEGTRAAQKRHPLARHYVVVCTVRPCFFAVFRVDKQEPRQPIPMRFLGWLAMR